jgi:hypothetical protein
MSANSADHTPGKDTDLCMADKMESVADKVNKTNVANKVAKEIESNTIGNFIFL